MPFDFDELIDRRDTDSLKYDFAVRRNKPADILPLWVADMDFKAPPAVIEALTARAQHGIFGYTDGRDAYYSAVQNWFFNRFQWETRTEWIIKTPGVVFAISAAVRAFTERGDAVLIQPPVYYPFTETIEANARRLVKNELIYEDGRYSIDFEDFERKITENQVKLFILCSPHNPVGRVWTREELTQLGEICLAHNVLVISDEIHADFTYPGHPHTVFADLDARFAANSITCTAPSKTFNLASLQISNIFIPDRELRRRFKQELTRAGYSQPNVMGLEACRAAYEHGGPWLDELRTYLLQNLLFAREYIARSMPGVRLVEPEGTYLIWLDFRSLGLSGKTLDDLIVYKAGLWLDAGEMFGDGGDGFQRINIACPRATLEEALKRLARALEERTR